MEVAQGLTAVTIHRGRAGTVCSTYSSVKVYEFRANYSEGGSKDVQPAPDLPFVYQEVRRLTPAAHVALGCRA
jgi:D-alanine-D-alanine ligase